jgi:hypothetical protein
MFEQLAGHEAQLHGLSIEEAGKRLSYGTLAGANGNFIFTETPKAACSTLKWLLAHIEGRHPQPQAIGIESSLAMAIHSPLVHGFPSLLAFDAQTVRTLLASESVVRFCVVRNPYTRVLSAWADKVRQREPRYRAVWQQIAAHAGTQGDECPSFAQFVAWLAETEDVRRCNHHWRGMTWVLLPDLMHYTHVLHTENLSEDLAGVLAIIAPGHDAAALLNRFRVNESLPLPDWRSHYDEETANRVHAFYREDFDRFGYHRDSWQAPTAAVESLEDPVRGTFQFAQEQRALAIIRARNDLIDAQNQTLRPLRQFAAGKGEPADLLRDLGAALLASGHARPARDLLRTALALRPHGTAIRMLLARSLIDCGQPDDARPHLDALLADPARQADAAKLLSHISPA